MGSTSNACVKDGVVYYQLNFGTPMAEFFDLGSHVIAYRLSDQTTQVCFSAPSGSAIRKLVLAGDSLVWLEQGDSWVVRAYDLERGTVTDLQEPVPSASDLALCAWDDTALWYLPEEDGHGVLRQWDPDRGAVVEINAQGLSLLSPYWLPALEDGRLVFPTAAESPAKVELRNMVTGAVEKQLSLPSAYAYGFLQEGYLVWSSGFAPNDVWIWNLKTDAHERIFESGVGAKQCAVQKWDDGILMYEPDFGVLTKIDLEDNTIGRYTLEKNLTMQLCCDDGVVFSGDGNNVVVIQP